MPINSICYRKLAWLAGALAIICLILPFVYPGAYWHGYASISFIPTSYDHGFDYYVKFDATSDSKWYVKRPTNFRYETGELYLHHDKIVSVDLTEMTIVDRNTSFKLTSEWLARWISEMDSPPPELITECATIVEVLVKAANGQLWKPRHHPYQFEEHQIWRMTHFAVGGNPWLPLFLPTIILLFVAVLLKYKENRFSKPVSSLD